MFVMTCNTRKTRVRIAERRAHLARLRVPVVLQD